MFESCCLHFGIILVSWESFGILVGSLGVFWEMFGKLVGSFLGPETEFGAGGFIQLCLRRNNFGPKRKGLGSLFVSGSLQNIKKPMSCLTSSKTKINLKISSFVVANNPQLLHPVQRLSSPLPDPLALLRSQEGDATSNCLKGRFSSSAIPRPGAIWLLPSPGLSPLIEISRRRHNV